MRASRAPRRAASCSPTRDRVPARRTSCPPGAPRATPVGRRASAPRTTPVRAGVGASRTSIGCPIHSGGGAPPDASPSSCSRTSTARTAARRCARARRAEPSVESPARGLALRGDGVDRASRPVSRLHATAASASSPQSSSTAATSGSTRHAWPANTVRERGRGLGARCSAFVGELDLHPAVELGLPPAGHRRRRRERSRVGAVESPLGREGRPGSVVRCATGNRNAPHEAPADPARSGTARPTRRRSTPSPRWSRRRSPPSATGGAACGSSAPSTHDRGVVELQALAPRTTSAATNGAGDSFSISTTATALARRRAP